MKNYIVTVSVLEVRGTQSWRIKAKSREEALRKVHDGEGYFENEELEVQSCDWVDALIEEV